MKGLLIDIILKIDIDKMLNWSSTIKHILFECPALNYIRHRFYSEGLLLNVLKKNKNKKSFSWEKFRFSVKYKTDGACIINIFLEISKYQDH